MIFDQYSRYMACADFLRQSGFVKGGSVLDIGSGPECLFGNFLPDARVSYVDPLITSDSGQGRIAGDVFTPDLDGKRFDCVSAIDVLEHVPPETRPVFLKRLASLAETTLILGFPTRDSSDAPSVDRQVNHNYRNVFGREYPWLEEHHRYGLPSLSETVSQLQELGLYCQTMGHGHAPWLTELLSFVISVWDIPSMRKLVDEISEEFNRNLYAHDFRPPFYRQFVVASRKPLPPLLAPVTINDDEAAELAFRRLMKNARARFFSSSLRVMETQEALDAKHQQQLHEVSEWAVGLQRLLSEKDEQIEVLNQQVQNKAEESASYQASISERDEQITRLTSEIEELSERSNGLHALLSEQNAQANTMEVRLREFSEQIQKLQDSIKDKDGQVSLLQQALSDKNTELMKMSDWAYGMMQELKRIKTPLHVKFFDRANSAKQSLRTSLANTALGDLVRHVRDSRRYRKNMVSFEAIENSLQSNNGRLVITFPIITWDFRWQRPQHIVSRLRDHGYSIIYLAMSMTPLHRRFRSSREAGAALQFNNLAPNINQIWLHSEQPMNIYTTPLAQNDLFNVVSGLQALLNSLRPKSIHYLIQFPGWWPAVDELTKSHGGRVIFDCMDDHGGFSTNSAHALKTEQGLIERADLVITSSALLEERCSLLNPNTIQVKNGTEFDHFHDPKPNGELDHLKESPIIGYYGAISDWFDMKIVAHCAIQRPDWNFVLIGATFGADLSPVEKLQNVHFLGEKPYTSLPGYLAYFDVCTIPFKLIPLTLATNPVKFYEYLSAGKPVVSIDLPELIPHAEDCYLARNADEFLDQLEAALRESQDPQKIKSRLKIAKANSWDSRAKSILAHRIFKD